MFIEGNRTQFSDEQLDDLAKALDSFRDMLLSWDRLVLSIRPAISETWQGAVLGGLFTHTARTYAHLVAGYRSLDVPLLGWAGRNLVELRIWNRYIWASNENMRRFHDDNIIDKYEMIEPLLNVLKGVRPVELETTIKDLEGSLAEVEEEWNRTLLNEEAKGLRVKALAKDVGLHAFYLFWFGTLSKCAHPTPGLLIGVESGREAMEKNSLEPILVMGVQTAIEILNTFIQALGMEDAMNKWAELHSK